MLLTTAAGDREPGPDVIDVDAMDPTDLSLAANVPDPRLQAVIAARGLDPLRPVQGVAIQAGLFWRRSVLACSPSGSGKTLIGELAAAGSVLAGYGKAAYLVPLVALATEKFRQLVSCYGPLGIRVELCVGDHDVPPDDVKAADIVVMTYEKLDAMLRSSALQGEAAFATVVVDEVHAIGEPGRGPRLESLVVRATAALPDLQLVALSATIANPYEVRDWLASLGLDVVLLLSSARPVPLHHEITVSRDDLQAAATIAGATIAAGGQCLAFARSRKKAELLAKQLAGALPAATVEPATREARSALAFRVKRANPRGSLPPVITRGVAYHHAGLAPAERDAVERGFLEGTIDVICCTTTLSAGINMPARAVILMDHKQVQAREGQVATGPSSDRFTRAHPAARTLFVPVPRNTFHQIAGRAGRAGFDTTGTAHVLVHSQAEADFIREHYFVDGVEPRYDPLVSCLSDREHAREQLLVAVNEAGEITAEGLRAFFGKTFFNHGRDRSVAMPVDTALNIARVGARALVPGGVPSGVVVEVAEAGPARLSGTVSGMACQLAPGGSWSCGCKDAAGTTAIDGTCPHVRFLARAVVDRQPDIEDVVDAMLVSALRDACHLDYLADHGFIEAHDGVYRSTPFGRLASGLYVLPAAAVVLKAALFARVESDDPASPAAWLLATVRDVLDAINQARPKAVYVAAWHWIHEQPLDVVLSPSSEPATGLAGFPAGDEPVYPGDFGAFVQDLARWARACGRIAQHLAFTRFSAACHVLEQRVAHGVKAELLPLVTAVKGVGRVRGRVLLDAGFARPGDLVATGADAVQAATGLLLPTCERLVAAARAALAGEGDPVLDGGDWD